MAGLQHDSAIMQGLSEAQHDEMLVEKKNSIESQVRTEDMSDGIHDGLEFPTEEERLTLRRVSDSIPWNAYRESRDKCIGSQ
jgi:POT family proton-dependent oligopeptide transporter